MNVDDINDEYCMLQQCKNCPGEEDVRTLLENTLGVNDDLDLEQEVRLSQWVSTDRCTLTENVLQLSEFMDRLSALTVSLTRHHYIAQRQNSFFDELKTELQPKEAIVVLDFSENYCFLFKMKFNSITGRRLNVPFTHS